MLTDKKKTPLKGQKLNVQSKLSEVNLTEENFTDNLGPNNREEDLENLFQVSVVEKYYTFCPYKVFNSISYHMHIIMVE